VENNSHTGKRGAVRNNSGAPVDHSGPELRVGPTTPATADRKSEACPPDFAGADVGVDVAVGAAVSQHKSGRESESGALSVASEASDVLRSAATQRGSSLDYLQTNRYTQASAEMRRLGRKKHCGARTLRGISLDGSKDKYVRLNCKTWTCSYCGPRRAWQYREAIRHTAEQLELKRFLTLTLDPSKIEGDPVRFLRKVFNKFRVYLLRKYNCSITYIAVLEFHKSGIPHLHILLDRFIPQRWISESWSSLGGGSIVHIKLVDVHRIAHYLAKYLTKELLMSAPARSRRVTTSRSIHLLAKKKSDSKWVLLENSIFHLFAILSEFAQEVQLDCDGFIFSFSTPIGSDVPEWFNRSPILTLTLLRSRYGCFALFSVR
jgi:hypothetical protein